MRYEIFWEINFFYIFKNMDEDSLIKDEYWKLKRKKQKLAKKEKRKKQIEEILSRGGDPSLELKPLRKKKRLKEEIEFSPIRVIIDLQYESMMTEKEKSLLVKQIYHIYGSNANAEHPLRLTLTSFEGNVANGVQKIGGFSNWTCLETTKSSYLDAFDQKELVYLTAESNESLEELNEKDVYIIGGLVDHNRLKGISNEIATKQGLRTARLPVSEYVDMKTRKVLTVNQVFDILLYKTILKEWDKVFEHVLPKRKGGKIKSKIENNNNEDTTIGSS